MSDTTAERGTIANPVSAQVSTTADGDNSKPLYVLKFGGSVLKSLDDFPAVAGEIYRQWRKGRSLVVVVSALAGTTDRLFEEARAVAGGADCTGIADAVSSGEEHAAALLRLACNRIGIDAALCRAEAIGLRAQGQECDADPTALAGGGITAILKRSDIVIVPGFVALGADGGRMLLGRGGTDTSAVFLAGELGAACVRLYKDVDGVFEADPAQYPAARKYREVSWDKALVIAEQLVHAKAVRYAQSKQLPIEVEGIGGKRPSRIAERNSFIDNSEPHRPVRIALAGYGIVGQQLTQLLAADPHYQIAAILVRDRDKRRDVSPPIAPTMDIKGFEQVEADLLVDALSSDRLSAQLCLDALYKGRSAVTASKRLMAADMAALLNVAQTKGADIRYSAAVGGSMPLLEAIDRCEPGAIRAVHGILNGTVNFVLHQLALGQSLAEAIARARKAGFAEKDCSHDLSGADAAAKLAIIAHRAFGIDPKDVQVGSEILDDSRAAAIAASGERWYQLAAVERKGNRVRGHVRLVPESEAGAGLNPCAEWNAARIDFECGRASAVRGRGAGGYPTAHAMLADLEDLRAWGPKRP